MTPSILSAVRPSALCCAILLIAAPAFAQPAPPADPTVASPRFAFAPADGGALKMDTQTGKVSFCAKGPSGFACEAVPDSRDAYEAEIARLQAENARLRTSVPLPPGSVPNPPGTPADPNLSEIDRAFDYMEHIYRRLRGLVERYTVPSGSEKL